MGDSGKTDSENKCDCNEAAPIVVISHSRRCSDGCGLRSDYRQCTSKALILQCTGNTYTQMPREVVLIPAETRTCMRMRRSVTDI